MNRSTNCYRCASPPIQIALVELRSRVFRTSSATLLQPWDAKKTLGVKPSLVFDDCTNLLMGYSCTLLSIKFFRKNKLILLHYERGMRNTLSRYGLLWSREPWTPSYTSLCLLLFIQPFCFTFLFVYSNKIVWGEAIDQNTQHRSGGRRTSSL